MEEDSIIRIHEISREVISAPLLKFSNEDTKKDLASLIEDLRYVDGPVYSDINDISNYTGFLKDDDTILYYSNGKKIFSRLDESLGVECGLISFRDNSKKIGDCRMNFGYKGGRDNRFSFDGDDNSPINKLKELPLENISVFNPKRNASHLFDEFDYENGPTGSWKFFEEEENDGSFFLGNHPKGFYLNLMYGGPYGSKNISEFYDIYKNLQNFDSFEAVKSFLLNKKVDVATLNFRYLKKGSTFGDVFDGKIKYA